MIHRNNRIIELGSLRSKPSYASEPTDNPSEIPHLQLQMHALPDHQQTLMTLSLAGLKLVKLHL